MKNDKLKEALSLIKLINQKNLELEKNLLELTKLTRNEMLIEITTDIIKKHKILQEEGFLKEEVCKSETEEEDSISFILDNLISNIKKSPSKKIIYLRAFLDRFPDDEINDQDKNAIMQSIQDENPEDLKEKLLSLIKVFKIEF
ncbi:MAG: hypothetical protein ACFE8E_09885 [Candidatus Hodarchaeota archaeon]